MLWKELSGIWRELLKNSPMSLALAATGLRNSATNFLASSRISIMLFSRANRGARGKDATNRVTKPNWMTGERRGKKSDSKLDISVLDTTETTTAQTTLEYSLK